MSAYRQRRGIPRQPTSFLIGLSLFMAEKDGPLLLSYLLNLSKGTTEDTHMITMQTLNHF
jgi:hypothetical protein